MKPCYDEDIYETINMNDVDVYVIDVTKENVIPTKYGYILHITKDKVKCRFLYAIEDMWALDQSEKGRFAKFGNGKRSKYEYNLDKLNGMFAKCLGIYIQDPERSLQKKDVSTAYDMKYEMKLPKREYDTEEYQDAQYDCFEKQAYKKSNHIGKVNEIVEAEIIEYWDTLNGIQRLIDKDLNVFYFTNKDISSDDEILLRYNGRIKYCKFKIKRNSYSKKLNYKFTWITDVKMIDWRN